MVIQVQNLNLSKLSKMIEERQSKSSHNSLQSQLIYEFLNSFITPFEITYSGLQNFSDSQANLVTSTKLTAMYDFENDVSYRNSTYDIGILVVSKLKSPSSTAQTKMEKCKNYANLKPAFIQIFY